MLINTNNLFSAFDSTQNIVNSKKFLTEDFKPIQTMFADKRNHPDAKIMVYGIYNAGKSTLINALLGKEEAATDDVPKTDIVTAYRWGRYEILDTPGVDAPIKHEKITNEEMLKADAIIFVVNPIGAAEETHTLRKLLELVAQRKQVILVLNEKTDVSEFDFVHLKDKIRSRLQLLAGEYGLNDTLRGIRIEIVKVNAKRALTAKLRNIPPMLEAAGYIKFERDLKEFLDAISLDEMYGRLKNGLVDFVDRYLETLKLQSNAKVVQKYDQILQSIEAKKAKIRRDVQQEIRSSRSQIADEVRSTFKGALLAEQQLSESEINSYITSLFTQNAERISTLLTEETQYLVVKLQEDIEDLQASIAAIKTEVPNGFKLPSFDTPQEIQHIQVAEQQISNMSPEAVTKVVEQLSQLAKPEHIVQALQIVKNTFPSLMTGIGPKTMQIWAGNIGSKLPMLGTFIQIGMALFDIFKGDSQADQMRQQVDAQNRQRERAIQQIDDFARDISSQFEVTMRENTDQSIELFFQKITDQIHALRAGFGDKERENSELIEKMSAIREQVANA